LFQIKVVKVDIIQEIKNGTVYANYIRTLNIDKPSARIKSDGTIRYYQTDALGSVIALTDETGVVKTTYTYDPFGNVTVSGEASDNPFQYTGRENDGTGFYYYRARYYSPELQRFISEDPIRIGTLLLDIFKPLGYRSQRSIEAFRTITSAAKEKLLRSLINNPLEQNYFSYVRNNPLTFIDPFGYKECKPGPWILCWAICEGICETVTEGNPLFIPLCFETCHQACDPVKKDCGCE
jgi:RHS repeat-associated protein